MPAMSAGTMSLGDSSELGYVRNILPRNHSVPFFGVPVDAAGAEGRANQPMLCTIDQEVFCGPVQPGGTFNRSAAQASPMYSAAGQANGLDRAFRHVQSNTLGYRLRSIEMGNNCGVAAGTASVNVHNGNLVLSYSLPCGGPADPPLRLFYNSLAFDAEEQSPYGQGWSGLYFQWVEDTDDTDPNGDRVRCYLTEMISPAGIVWQIERDWTDGKVLSLTTPDNRTVTYSYTNNLLTSITDANGRTTSFGTNASGLLSSITGPDGRSVTFEYDQNGQLTEWRNGEGDFTTFSYDTMNLSLIHI